MIEESYCVTMSGRGGLPCRAKRRLAFTLAGWRRASAGGLIAGLLISGWGLSVYGQEIAYTHGRQTDPGMGLEGSVEVPGSQTPQPLATALTSDGLAPEMHDRTIDATAAEPYTSSQVKLGADEARDLPTVVSPGPTTTTTVEVAATLNDIAQAQVQEQEKQRVLGLLPNFYSSYIWTAAPMTTKLKLQLTVKSILDPMTFLVAASLAGIEQGHNTFPGYGQGSEGYAKRFGSAYADASIGRVVGRAILPAVLHQDPRYFYRGSGSFRSRFMYALAQSIVCRGDNGAMEPNYSQLFGSFAVAGLANLYRTPDDRHSAMTYRHALIALGNGALDNLLREFFSRKLTPNVPAFANGKP